MIHSTSGNTIAPLAPPPSSVPPPLTDSSRFCQMSLHFATLPEQISAKFQFLQVLLQKKNYKITHCTQLIFCYPADPLKPVKLLQFTWLRIQHIPFTQSEQGKGAATACEPHALPQNPKHCHCCTISIYFFVIAVLGCGRSFSKGPVVMDISHQEQQFCCCSL